MHDTPLIEVLYRALRAEYGVVVTTSDPKRLRQKLYTARKDSGDPDLDTLTFCESRTNPATEIWIVRKDAK